MPRVGDRRVISGIVFVIRNRPRWRTAAGILGYTHRDIVSGAGHDAVYVLLHAILERAKASP